MTIDYNNLTSIEAEIEKYKAHFKEVFAEMCEEKRLAYLSKWLDENVFIHEYLELWMNRPSKVEVDTDDELNDNFTVKKAEYRTTKKNKLSDSDVVCNFIEWVTDAAVFNTEIEKQFQKENDYSLLTDYGNIRNGKKEEMLSTEEGKLEFTMKTARKLVPHTVTVEDREKYFELQEIKNTIDKITKFVDNEDYYKDWLDQNGKPVTRGKLLHIRSELRTEIKFVKDRLVRPIVFRKLGNGDNHHVYDHFSDTGYFVDGAWEPLMIKMKNGDEIECENQFDLTDIRYVKGFMKCYKHVVASIKDVPDHTLGYFLEELEEAFDKIEIEPYEREAAIIYMTKGKKYEDISKDILDMFGIELSKTDLSRILTQDIPNKIVSKIKESIREYRNRISKVAKHCTECKNIRMFEDYSPTKRANDGMSKVCNHCKGDGKRKYVKKNK